MTAELRAALRVFAELPDARMLDPTPWPGHEHGDQLEVRDALYLSLLEEREAAARAPMPSTEAERGVGYAEEALGDLWGMLIGLPEGLLDADPGNAEWSLRAVLAHVLEVEQTYASRIAYARVRNAADPLVNNVEDLYVDADLPGGIDTWLDRLEAARANARAGASLSETELDLPTQWSNFNVSVRFRLHRFTAHLVEHTIQCDKTLIMLRHVPSEAQRIVRRIAVGRAAHAWRSSPTELARLDAAHAARVGLLARK